MRATIVVINYNGGRAVVENLRSIVREADPEANEIIVVDNGSGDGSDEAVRHALPGIRLLSEPVNRGYASAINRGLAEAAGDAIVVMNGDVRPLPGSLDALIEVVRARRDFAILGGVLTAADGSKIVSAGRRLPTVRRIVAEGLFLPSPRRLGAAASGGGQAVNEVPAVSGALMGIARATLDRLGPMDEQYFLYNEDAEWCRRAARAGLKVGVVPGARFAHAGGASTRRSEGAAFAARVLSDFQYFCEGEGVSPLTVRRLWRVRLAARSWLYRLDAAVGAPSRRDSSRRRAAIYRLLGRALRGYRWSTDPEVQNGHPRRLIELPDPAPRRLDDRRPTVLHIIPDMDYGGAQRVVEATVTGPLAERFRFEILCLRRAGEIGEALRRRGHRVHAVGMSGWRRVGDWRRAADFAALIAPDLVHSHLLPADIAAWLGFRARAPRVSTKHSVDRWMWWLPRLVERLAHVGSETIMAVSDATAWSKSYLGGWGALPVVVSSPPTVPIAEAPAPLFPPERRPRVAILGRLDPIKRVDLFIRAATLLEERFAERFEFRIIGDGPESGALRALADRAGMGERIEFRGAVSDIGRELDEVDVVVLLSEREGFGLTVLETLARGRIPLVRRAAGAPEALPPHLADCLLESASPEEVAARFLEIVEQGDRYAALVRSARPFVLDRRRSAGALGRVYDGILRPRTGVLHLITRLIVGGAQENTIATVERVAPDRYQSHLWTGPQTGAEGSLIGDARARGIAVRVLPNLVREIHPWKDLLVTLQLVALLKRERFDIVHTHSSKAGIVGRIAARLAGVPHVVHTVHGWGFHEHMHPVLRTTYVLLERLMAPWTRPLVSVSNRTTRIGLAAGIGDAGSYRLIRSGIPVERFHPDGARRAEVRRALGVRSDEIVIGSVGRLSAQKNPLDFVAVASSLIAARPGLRFLYVGDGPLRSAVERDIEARGLGGCVSLLGVRDDVPDLLRALDLFVLTSLWEGLPRVVPQALATGVPVVAYDTAGIEEAVSDGVNGYLVPPGEVETMVGRLEHLIGDPSARAAMSARAREGLSDEFTEERMIRDLEILYGELTRSRRPAGAPAP